MRILITGACGFVGSTLARTWSERGARHTLFGLDNLSRPGSEINRPVLRAHGVTLIHADVRLASDVDALPEVEWVVEAAANPSVLAGVGGLTSPRQLVEHNLIGTLNMLEFCRRTRAGFLLLSTSRVYSIPSALTHSRGECQSRIPPRTRRRWCWRVAARHRRGLLDRAAGFTLRRDQAGVGTDGARVRRRVRLPGLDQSLRRAGRPGPIRARRPGHLLRTGSTAGSAASRCDTLDSTAGAIRCAIASIPGISLRCWTARWRLREHSNARR